MNREHHCLAFFEYIWLANASRIEGTCVAWLALSLARKHIRLAWSKDTYIQCCRSGEDLYRCEILADREGSYRKI